MGGYLRYPDGTLVEWTEQPYDSEDLLQTFLADYPNLLAGQQINPQEPRRWLLITREMGVPSEQSSGDRWSVDHLFLDQDAIPTLVEVKRSSDTRIRREMVGQLLEYAANATRYWPVDRIQEAFEDTCADKKEEPWQVLTEFLGPAADHDHFWETAALNLQAGKVRMIFVSDQVPSELERIVEFLNGQMNPAEVLAIEIKQYVAGEYRQFAPRLIGQTIEAMDRKLVASRGKKEWDEESFLAKLETNRSAQEVEVAKSILQWAHHRGLRIIGGRGTRDGSLYPTLDIEGDEFTPIGLWTSEDQIQIQFETIMEFPPFDQESERLLLRNKLDKALGLHSPQDSHSLSTDSRLLFAELSDEKALSQFTHILEWVLNEVKAAYVLTE